MSYLRRFWFAAVMVLLHTSLVAYVWWCVRGSVDPEALMGWGLPLLVDLPSSLLVRFVPVDNDSVVCLLLFCGGLQWFLLGLVVHRGVTRLTTRCSRSPGRSGLL